MQRQRSLCDLVGVGSWCMCNRGWGETMFAGTKLTKQRIVVTRILLELLLVVLDERMHTCSAVQPARWARSSGESSTAWPLHAAVRLRARPRWVRLVRWARCDSRLCKREPAASGTSSRTKVASVICLITQQAQVLSTSAISSFTNCAGRPVVGGLVVACCYADRPMHGPSTATVPCAGCMCDRSRCFRCKHPATNGIASSLFGDKDSWQSCTAFLQDLQVQDSCSTAVASS